MSETKGTKNLAAAMIQAQMNMKPLLNVANNPFFKSKYAPLSEVKAVSMPALNGAGIAVFEGTSTQWEDGKVMVYVSCRFVHAESGEEWAEEISLIPVVDKYGVQTPQAIGSAITYARRYLLTTMTGLASQDDDGNDASQVGQQRPPQNYPPKQNKRQSQPVKPKTVANMPEVIHPSEVAMAARDDYKQHITAIPDPVESLDDVEGVPFTTLEPSPFDDSTVGATANTTIDTTSATFKRFMAGGKGYYGDGWDDKRKALVSSVSKGRTDSATELTIDEVKRLIVGIEELADAEAPS